MLHFKVFYPDGLSPEESVCRVSELSGRWLDTCGDILDRVGVVFSHNMGSTLSQFDVRMAGPIGELLAQGRPCFSFAISSGTGSEQDRGTLQHFGDLHRAACSAIGRAPSAEAIHALEEAATAQSVLFIDHLTGDIPDEQKGALLELGQHFGAAFLRGSFMGSKG